MSFGKTSAVVHRIDTGRFSPINSRPCRISPFECRAIHDPVSDRIAKGHESTCPKYSPVASVQKKDDSCRVCVDYSRLEEVAKKDANSLFQVDDTLDALAGLKYFSPIHLRSL